MPLTLTEADPVLLNCQPLDGDTAVLVHEGTRLTDGLALEFINKTSTTTLKIADFEYDGKLCRVNAFTINEDGTMTPWERDAHGTWYQIVPREEAFDLDIAVAPVVYEPSGDGTATDMEHFTPSTWQTTVRVRVGKKGGKPTF